MGPDIVADARKMAQDKFTMDRAAADLLDALADEIERLRIIDHERAVHQRLGLGLPIFAGEVTATPTFRDIKHDLTTGKSE